jgi:hypothetical protein
MRLLLLLDLSIVLRVSNSGCVELADQDNVGIGPSIDTLAPIVEQFANAQTTLSRADVWVQAMYTALNHANKGAAKPINFTMNWVGRTDCENAGTACKNAQGQNVACSATAGPHRNISNVNMNSVDFANFWETTFNGMSLEHGTALIGCHTVGRLFRQASIGMVVLSEILVPSRLITWIDALLTSRILELTGLMDGRFIIPILPMNTTRPCWAALLQNRPLSKC